MERAHILDALHDPSPRLGQAVLVINHVASGEFWCCRDLLGPAPEFGALGRFEETADDQEAGAIGPFAWAGVLDYMLASGAVVLPLATTAIGIWRWRAAHRARQAFRGPTGGPDRQT